MADIRTWSCEIGVVPFEMIPDGGDQPFRDVVRECWGKMFPDIPYSIASGWGRVTAALPQHSLPSEWAGADFHIPTTPIPPQANLGCATTEDLMTELICRFQLAYPMDNVQHSIMVSRAINLARMLGGLSQADAEYRTVDSD